MGEVGHSEESAFDLRAYRQPEQTPRSRFSACLPASIGKGSIIIRKRSSACLVIFATELFSIISFHIRNRIDILFYAVQL